MSTLIEIRDVEGQGVSLFALEDLLPGQLILTEDPLLFIDTQDMKRFKRSFPTNPELSRIFCTWSLFEKQSLDKQARLLALFGPLHGQADQTFATSIKEVFLKFCTSERIEESLTKKLFQNFLRVYSISKYNSFGFDNDKSAIYEVITRLSHSCLPNTCCDLVGSTNKFALRVVLPVKKGQEMTTEYNKDYRTKPTHFRVYRYMLMKGFTCHCPRCDALGDDTRQFNCCDESCGGYHLVCQPINKDLFYCGSELITDMMYTGVEYVEPYLLPCSVCSRTASVDYEQEMIAFETRMPAILKQLETDFDELCKSDKSQSLALWETFTTHTIPATKFPFTHGLNSEVMELTFRAILFFLDPETTTPDTAPQQVEQWIAAVQWCEVALFDNVRYYELINAQFPNQQLAEMYEKAGTVFQMLNVSHALVYFRKAVLVGAIALGRQSVHQKDHESALVKFVDEAMRYDSNALIEKKFLFRLGGLLGECLFCGQSCEGTAFSLMKCSKCKNAEYCSRECQTLHWKFHKLSCGKVFNAALMIGEKLEEA